MNRLTTSLTFWLIAAVAAPPVIATAQQSVIADPAGQTPVTGTAASAPVQVTPYDSRLLRLSEILGSVHYLRMLCKNPDSESFRQSMQDILDKDAKGDTGGETERRAKLTAAFNRGYRSFASVYTACTRQAVAADEKYRAEGATLALEITSLYGN